jgi:hypothetical protein
LFVSGLLSYSKNLDLVLASKMITLQKSISTAK